MSTHTDRIDLRFADRRLRRTVDELCRLVNRAGGRALIVGGSVRDAALQQRAKDIDVEVYGLEPKELESLLQERFALDLVGKSFGVLKIKGLPIDVALPRRESKAGLGHRSFEVLSDPTMGTKEAQSRRDFTINAIYFDPVTGEVIDHFGGRADLAARILRHTSEKFGEDPLRVLRGMQFAARFDLTVADETVEICRTIEPEGLASERMFEEWKKLVLTGLRPSRGLAFLQDSHWIEHFPELAALVGCPQEPSWHPEGDVWQHTMAAMDVFARERVADEVEDLIVGLAVLCHDMGKPATTQEAGRRITSRQHESAGIEPMRRFLGRLTNQRDLADQIAPLVERHLAPVMFYRDGAGRAAIRRLANKVGRIDRLVRVARADRLGRGPAAPSDFPAGDWLLERAAELHVVSERPRPIVQGRHLIELGLKPGPHFREILDRCFEAQIDGEFDSLDGGREYARALTEAPR